MLNENSTQKNNISLVILAAASSIPFLLSYAYAPTSSYIKEISSAILFTLFIFTLVKKTTTISIPLKITIPLLIITAGIAFNGQQYQKLNYLGSMLLGIAIMIAGSTASVLYTKEKTINAFSYGLSIAGFFNAISGLVIFFDLNHYLLNIAFYAPTAGKSMYGQIAQANHFASIVFLGLFSLIHLFASKKISLKLLLILSAPSILSLGLSSSRSIYIFIISAIAISAILTNKSEYISKIKKYTIIISLLVLASCFITPLILNSLYTSSQRTILDESSAQRLYFYKIALQTWLDNPIFGVGFGDLSSYIFENYYANHIIEPKVANPIGHVHNIYLQVAAELGLIGLMPLVYITFIFLKALIKIRHQNNAAFPLYVTSIIFIHSNLEFPVWYTYFYFILCLSIGLTLDSENKYIKISDTALKFIQLLALVLCTFLIVTTYQYTIIVKNNDLILDTNNSKKLNELSQTSFNPLLTWNADMATANYITAGGGNFSAQYNFIHNLRMYRPIPLLIEKEYVLLKLMGKEVESTQLKNLLFYVYPRPTLNYKPEHALSKPLLLEHEK